MNKPKFQVIKGTKPKTLPKTYKFIKGQVTNTRLMGVIGLKIHWKNQDGQDFHQFFHLDAEEYGLDDYESLLDPTPKKIENITSKMMGGLGGEFVLVNEKEARYLIKTFEKKNIKQNESLPLPQGEYAFILKEEVNLSDEEIKNLWTKISEKITTPIQLVNYFIMRAVGYDQEGVDYLSTHSTDYHCVNKPSTLLKNVVETIHEEDKTYYITESIMDMDDKYKMVLSEIEVEKIDEQFKVSRAEIKSVMNITSTEASFALTKKEYLLIYEVKSVRKVMELLDQEKPHAMKHGYEIGYLYTEFNPTNEHVNQEIYYLNGDVYGVYYITAAGQLIVGAYSKDRRKELADYFFNGPFGEWLTLDETMDLDNSLLYEFVQSEYDNFYDFLDEE